MVNKIKENSVDKCPKYRKLKEEQFGQIKKNWCTIMVSQIKDFLIFCFEKTIFYLLVFCQLKMANKNNEKIDNN